MDNVQIHETIAIRISSHEPPVEYSEGYFEDSEGRRFSVKKVMEFISKNFEDRLILDFPTRFVEDQLSWWDSMYSMRDTHDKTRMLSADTSFPILIIDDDGILSVADGLNRLCKTIRILGEDTISAYLIPKAAINHLAEPQHSIEHELSDQYIR